MTFNLIKFGSGSLLFSLAWLCVGVPLSCANSTPPPPPQKDAGHVGKKDAMGHGACGTIGEACCPPPMLCALGAFCARDNTCRDQHPSDIGLPCSSMTTCSSLICGYTQGISDGAAPVPDGNGTPPPQPTGCTVGCFNTNPDCTPGWTCDQIQVGQGQCVCSWSPEICDGKDNNCDGIVDNEPEADNYCTAMDEGIPQHCVKGECKCDHLCSSTCVNINSDDKNCGMCDHACVANVEKCEGGMCMCAFTLCGTSCVDTKSTDNANCGGCGIPCMYECAGGTCGPATFASTLKSPGAIVLDNTNAYWVGEGTNHAEVQYCPLAGCPGGKPSTLATSSAVSFYQGQLGALAVTATNVYFSDDAGNIEVAPIGADAGAATVFSLSGDSTSSYLTQDGTNLYWANEGAKSIDGCALGTSCPGATTIDNPVTGSPQGMAVSGGLVYWAAAFAGTISIQSAPYTGGTPTTLCTLSGSASVKDLLIDSGNIYFTNPASAVHVCSLSATPPATAAVFYADKNTPTGLASDGTNLYWTESTAGGAIMKCALGTSCATPTMVTSAKFPVGIAVNATDIYYTSTAEKSVSVFHK